MKRNTFLLLLAAVALSTGCKSYEDSFNRNLDSTGLYVTNSGSNTISMFGADPKSGILNDLGTVAAGTTPVYITINSAGTFAYVVNSGSNDVYVYSIDKKSRKLTLASTATAGTTPLMIALHASGNWAYVVNSGNASKDISKYSVNATTGALTSLGATESTTNTPSGVAIFGDSLFTSISDANEIRFFAITATTGALTPSTTAAPSNPSAGVIVRGTTSSYSIYSPISASNQIARSTNATWVVLTTTSAGSAPNSIALNSANTQAYVGNSGDNTVSIYSVSNGALTAAGTAAGCTNSRQIFVNAADFVYLVCRTDGRINAYSAGSTSLTLIGSYATGTTPTSVAGY